MTYDECVARFEALFTYVYGDDIHSNLSQAPNGARYAQAYPSTKSGAGSAPEPATSTDAAAAFQAWFDHASAMIPPGQNTLFWRIMPHILAGGSGVYAFSSLAVGSSAVAGQWTPGGAH